MQILCQRCRKEVEISKEKIEQIIGNFIGDITPIDLLDYFSLWGGRCGEGDKGIKKAVGEPASRHDFIWSVDFCDSVKAMIKEMGDIDGRIEALDLSEKKIDSTILIIRGKLDEFEQKKISLKNDQFKLGEKKKDLLIRVEELTGTRDLEFWIKRSD